MTTATFKSIDSNFFVEIKGKFLNKIQKECIKSRSMETGGILIGNYSEEENIAIIQCITGPPKDSKRSMCTFKRGVNSLMDLLNNKWKLGQYYIGEWHFHPNSSSKPSNIDDEQMQKFSINKSLKCSKPILLVIGGNQDNGWKLSVHIYTKEDKIPLIRV